MKYKLLAIFFLKKKEDRIIISFLLLKLFRNQTYDLKEKSSHITVATFTFPPKIFMIEDNNQYMTISIDITFSLNTAKFFAVKFLLTAYQRSFDFFSLS